MTFEYFKPYCYEFDALSKSYELKYFKVYNIYLVIYIYYKTIVFWLVIECCRVNVSHLICSIIITFTIQIHSHLVWFDY